MGERGWCGRERGCCGGEIEVGVGERYGGGGGRGTGEVGGRDGGERGGELRSVPVLYRAGLALYT